MKAKDYVIEERDREMDRLNEIQENINTRFADFKKAYDLIEEARNCISDYVEDEYEKILDKKDINDIDNDLYNLLELIDSQLNGLKSDEDDIIEEQSNLHYGHYGSHSEDSQNYMSQWEFIPREKYE